MTLREWFTLGFVTIGVLFNVLAGLGILRMPDLFTRMSTVTKATTLGTGFILTGSIIYFWQDTGVVTRAFAVLLFLLLTAPVSAHMIARAGYFDHGSILWKETWYDEFEGAYKVKKLSDIRDSKTEYDQLRPVDLDTASAEEIRKAQL